MFNNVPCVYGAGGAVRIVLSLVFCLAAQHGRLIPVGSVQVQAGDKGRHVWGGDQHPGSMHSCLKWTSLHVGDIGPNLWGERD